MREKPLAPGFECLGIVELQDFHIRDDQTRSLDDRQYLRQSGYIAARKYVFGDPGIGDARRIAAANRMQERDAVVGQELGDGGSLRPIVCRSAMPSSARSLAHWPKKAS